MELARNRKKLESAMNTCLTRREKEILRLRFGLGGSKALTQNEIGERLGISRSYVSRIEKKAIRKLKVFFPE